MSIVLGINAYHAGASAALVVDGRIRIAIAEERLNRVKYFGGFPSNAIHACLRYCGLEFSDIDYVALGRDSAANLEKKVAYVIKHPLLVKNFVKLRSTANRAASLGEAIARECEVDPSRLRFRQVNVEHHLAHTASAYFVSGWDKAAGLTIDGSGDFVTCMFSECRGREIHPIHRIFVPDSLGSFYGMICQFIGYDKYGDEGKVMGLAPLGEDRFKDDIDSMISFGSGQIALNRKFFRRFGSDQGISIAPDGTMVTRRHFTDAMVSRFGEPRSAGGEITQRDKDLAFGLQRRFEEIYMGLLNHLHELCPDARVVLAGGCALNSVANGKIFALTPFTATSIQPAAGDEGLALGAALYVSHSVLSEGDNEPLGGSYLGLEYDEETIERELKSKGVPYLRLAPEGLLQQTAREIASGKILGWFQGRSEWGPRALGNRSILCHPGLPRMKDILNARIKRRESFRPFAPSVLAERQGEIFEECHPSPHMLHVYKIRPAWRERLSAVNHVDDTGRLQSVARSDNPLYYDLIRVFDGLTGIPVVLNTSFNENEPIVERPVEAIDCFLRTKMDVLVIGPFICRKVSSPNH